MRNYRKEIEIKTESRFSILNITDKVDSAVVASNVKEGLCYVSPLNVTCSCFVTESEKGIQADLTKWIEKMAPHEPLNLWKHNEDGEENGDAFLKRQLVGREVVLSISDGKLDMGMWDQIFYADFDGKKAKNVLVKIIGE
jgi:secondary thiamine-phosphate synthase enzyme